MLHVVDMEKHFRAMRVVNLMIYCTQDGHPNLVSKNDITLAPKIDMLDRKSLDTMRQVWMKKVSEAPDEKPTITYDSSRNVVEFMSAAMQVGRKRVTQALIEDAELPVPSEYAVVLPIASKDVRRHILSCLIPFRESRDMLLRLEDNLDLPMRCVRVGHMPLMPADEVRETLKIAHSNLLGPGFVTH